MNVLFKKLMESATSDGTPAGGGSPAVGGSSPAAAPLEKGRAETPDFSAIADSSDDLIVDTSEIPPAASGAEAEPAAAAAPATGTPQQPAAEPAVPAATPPAPQAAAPAPAEPQPQAQPPAPEAPAPAATTEPPLTIEQHREKALPELAKLYQLSAEEAEAVRVSPETALPQLAAKLHFEVVMSAHQAVMAQLPQFIAGYVDHQNRVNEANTKFFDRWAPLKDPKHLARVQQSIKAYRTANPQATMEEVIEGAGALAMISLGLPVTPPQASTPAAPSAAPAARPLPPPGRGAPSAPFAPPPSQVPTDDVSALVEAHLQGLID